MTAAGPLTKTLDYAGDMLAACGTWIDLCGEEATPRDHVYIAELPRAWSQDIHTAEDLRAAAPWAIVHLDDQGVGASFRHVASSNHFIGQYTVIMRLYLVPPEEIDEHDTNAVETWVLNQVGTIIQGTNATTSPGLIDLSHQGGQLIIRGLDVLGPMYPSDEQRAQDHALVVACELVLQVGMDGP